MPYRLQALFGLVAVLAGAGAVGLALYDARHASAEVRPIPKTAVVVSSLPTATPAPQPSASASPTPSPPLVIPRSLFIRGVPYTVQSPFNQWGANDPHQEYCEAAALLMVGRYHRGITYSDDRIPAVDADQAMAQIVAQERQAYPGILDLSLDKVAAVAKSVYNLDGRIEPATLDNAKAAMVAGKPVLIPVNTHGGPGGQKIAPFYGTPGVYHVVVLIGFDGTTVYANDAGFTQGQRYAYSWPILESAMDAQAALPKPQTQGRVMLTFTPAS